MDEDGPSTIAIEVVADGWHRAGCDASAVCREAVCATIATAAAIAPSMEISILLADDAELRRLNHTWRGRDQPTNVLSFPAVDSCRLDPAPATGLPRLLGDLALAIETVRAEAEDQGKRFEHHLCHLVIHGTLHLLGHGHESEADAEAMEDLERAILDRLGIPDPYAEPDAPIGRGPQLETA